VRASSFQGLNEEFVVAVGAIELRASQPAATGAEGAVTVRLDPANCIVLPATEE
jgi:hypothetical protein